MVRARHAAALKRLRRADGHLHSVIEMLESGRDCRQVAQQLQAVESAIVNAKRELIHDHLGECLDEALGRLARPQRKALRDVRAIAKFL